MVFGKILAELAANSAQLSQIRTKANTVNFFQRRTGDVLWKTVTNVSPGGIMRGRARTRQAVRPLPLFYKIGSLKSSPMRVLYPGLNAPLRDDINPVNLASNPFYLEEQTDEERQNTLHFTRECVERRGHMRKSYLHKERLNVLDRGFSGGTYLGQKMGPPPDIEGNSMADFECICFFTDRVTRMDRTKGRVFTCRALVFIGNGKGVGGYALGRAPSFKHNQAIGTAIKKASKNLFHIDLYENRTVFQDFFAECRNTRIFVQREVDGYGLRCHPRLIKICQLLGIKDLRAQVHGSTKNYVALTHAFITGLVNQETHQKLADRTRLNVVELSPNRQYYPRIVATPLNAPVKDDSEVDPKERMKLDDYYGEGRYPLKKLPPKPFYGSSAGHLHAEWSKHPFRNMEGKIIRLLADGVVDRWTRTERYRWSRREFEMVMSGQKPMPLGIGLTHVDPPRDEESGR